MVLAWFVGTVGKVGHHDLTVFGRHQFDWTYRLGVPRLIFEMGEEDFYTGKWARHGGEVSGWSNRAVVTLPGE